MTAVAGLACCDVDGDLAKQRQQNDLDKRCRLLRRALLDIELRTAGVENHKIPGNERHLGRHVSPDRRGFHWLDHIWSWSEAMAHCGIQFDLPDALGFHPDDETVAAEQER